MSESGPPPSQQHEPVLGVCVVGGGGSRGREGDNVTMHMYLRSGNDTFVNKLLRATSDTKHWVFVLVLALPNSFPLLSPHLTQIAGESLR